MTKVLYKLQGSPVIALNRVASVRNTRDWVISYSGPNPKRAVTEPATAHRNGIPPSSRISWNRFEHNILNVWHTEWVTRLKQRCLLVKWSYRPLGLRIESRPKAEVAFIQLVKTWLLKCFRIHDLAQLLRYMGCCSIYPPLQCRKTCA